MSKEKQMPCSAWGESMHEVRTAIKRQPSQLSREGPRNL